MDIKKILVLAIIVLAVFSCLNVASAGLFDFLIGDQYLQGDDCQIKIPSNFTIDDKNFVAVRDDMNITFTPIIGADDASENQFFSAIKVNGKEAGYENVSNKTVNGYTVHEFAAHPDKLKNVSTPKEYSGNEERWTEYSPVAVSLFDDSVDHFRSITFMKDGKQHILYIFTNSSDVNLYTPEVEGIIDSIGPIE